MSRLPDVERSEVVEVLRGASWAVDHGRWARAWRPFHGGRCAALAVTTAAYSQGASADVAAVALACLARHVGSRGVGQWNDRQLTRHAVVVALHRCADRLAAPPVEVAPVVEPVPVDRRLAKLEALAVDARAPVAERIAALQAVARLAGAVHG